MNLIVALLIASPSCVTALKVIDQYRMKNETIIDFCRDQVPDEQDSVVRACAYYEDKCDEQKTI
jgi:hypothetical protein